MTSLKTRLLDALAASGRTKSELARYVGTSAQAVQAWADGSTKKLAGMNLIRAAEFLGVTPEWLDSGKGQRSKGGVGAVAHITKADLSEIEAQVINMFRAMPAEIKGQLLGELASRYYALTDRADQPPLVPGATLIKEPTRESQTQHRTGARKTTK